MINMTIEKVGMFVSWVDLGRRFAQEQGFCQSGPVDWFNYALANAICGNPANTPVLEVLAGHFSFHCDQDIVVCVTGAKTNVLVENKEYQQNTLIFVEAHQRFSLTEVKQGLYNYVAIIAQADIPKFKDSVCGVLKEATGGFHKNGSSLQNKDIIKLKQTTSVDKHTTQKLNALLNLPPLLSHFLDTYFGKIISLPIGLCYQSRLFDSLQITRFLNNEYQISPNMDKMGIRLKGPAIQCQSQTLQSQALAMGSVQITGEGQAIIMRNERQTMGGYPIIGVVSLLGLARLSQAGANNRVRFELCHFQETSISLSLLREALAQLTSTQHQLLNKESL